MNAHTSGPWRIHRGYENEQTRTACHNGETWEYTHTYVSQGDKIIAQVQHQSTDGGWPHVHDVEEMWANARLIAAAPELLGALEALLADPYLADPINADRMAKARAAVSRVKGGEA